MKAARPATGAREVAVAIVEDNAGLLEDLLHSLKRHGFDATGFADGSALDAALAEGVQWQVLVLDLGLPGEDGLSIARRLRASLPGLGIVMLTARSAVDDRIAGLTVGADIYLTKPADLHEVAAAVAAVARRVGHAAAVSAAASAWELDSARMQLRQPEGEAIDLTISEVQILQAIARSPDRIADRDTLIRALGKNPLSYDEHTLEVMVSRLRQKLGGRAPLRAVRGKGYAFTAPMRLLPSL